MYAEILEELLREVATEEAQAAKIGKRYETAVNEARCRESICQILADAPVEIRNKYLQHYRQLDVYYPQRLK